MTPLVLIVGFLGSGKTTFLKNLLPLLSAQGLRPRVIINDYQNAQVDAEQLRAFVDEISAISGDCVCCGSKDELLEALHKFDHAPGRVAVIETNGTTDSENLIEMLSLEVGLNKFSLPMQVSVIDGQRWQKRFWHNALEREQARTASHLFISRLDTIPEARTADVESSLTKHHVRGQRTTPEAFALELAEVTRTMAQQEDRGLEASTCADCGGHHHHEEHHHDHEEGEHHHQHTDHHFASLEFPLPTTVDRNAFENMLRNLPDEVIRAKGIVRFSDTPKDIFIFQKVDRFDAPQFFPAGESPRINTPLVLFIGPSLPAEGLKSGLENLQAD
ncbi:GTP-binding protein [soil metagenome]